MRKPWPGRTTAGYRSSFTESRRARSVAVLERQPLNLFNPNMKALPLDAEVMAHGLLGLDASEAAHAMGLRERLERELGLGRFAGLAAGGPSREQQPKGRHG